MEQKNNKLIESYKAQKAALLWFLGFIYISFIGIQLGQIQEIMDYNFNLHELMFVFANIAIFICPIIFFIYIFLLIKYLRERGKKKFSKKRLFQIEIVLLSFFFMIIISYNQSMITTITAIIKVERKQAYKGEYFINFDDKQIKVSANEYHLIEKDKEYVIHYESNKNNLNEGKLKTIEVMNQ